MKLNKISFYIPWKQFSYLKIVQIKSYGFITHKLQYLCIGCVMSVYNGSKKNMFKFFLWKLESVDH